MDLTSEEKQRRIQELYRERNDRLLGGHPGGNEEGTGTDAKATPTAHPCTHYQRKCKSFATCCNSYFGCRFCHDESPACNETFDRFSVPSIKCNECGATQAPSAACSECKVPFAESFCSTCNLWTHQTIYHCNDCGVCRVGSADDYVHCPTCDLCFQKGHECTAQPVSDARSVKCPVCLETLFDSRKPQMFLRCGHQIHVHCFESSVSTFNSDHTTIPRCPICKRTHFNMESIWAFRKAEKERTEMPDEYKNVMVKIACNDCTENSATEFHVVGLECKRCGSFNTQRIGLVKGEEDTVEGMGGSEDEQRGRGECENDQ